MKDWDDIANFTECVSAITLCDVPQGFMAECLNDPKLDLTIGLAKLKCRGPELAPWLQIGTFDDYGWIGNIKSAHLDSDHLECSTDLYTLQSARDLTIHISGRRFDEADVKRFRNAIGDLANLQTLVLIVEPDALEQAQDDLRWPSARFNCQIEVNPGRRRAAKRRLSTE